METVREGRGTTLKTQLKVHSRNGQYTGSFFQCFVSLFKYFTKEKLLFISSLIPAVRFYPFYHKCISKTEINIILHCGFLINSVKQFSQEEVKRMKKNTRHVSPPHRRINRITCTWPGEAAINGHIYTAWPKHEWPQSFTAQIQVTWPIGFLMLFAFLVKDISIRLGKIRN